MSKLGSLVNKNKVVEVEYPGITGFKIKVMYIPREDLQRIRDEASEFKFNPMTRQRTEQIDQDKFLEMYVNKAIQGWTGLKMQHLAKLFPVDLTGVKVDDELTYSKEDALDLVKSSVVFDQFLTDCMNDLNLFSTVEKEKNVKN